MTIIVLIGIDPFAQPGIDFISKFNNYDDCYKYLTYWLDEKLEHQKKLISGLRGNKDKHVENYISFVKSEGYIKYYGEFTTESSEPYEYKWLIYEL